MVNSSQGSILSWPITPSLKSLVNWFKKISSFNPHWALGEPTHVFGLYGFKIFLKHGLVHNFSIKPITYSWSWALLLLKMIFEFWPQKLGYIMTSWPNAFLQKKKKRIGPKLRVYHGFVDHLLSFFWIFLLNFYFYFLFWSWKLFFLFFLKIPFLKKIIYKRIFFNYFLCKTFLFLNSFSLQFFFFKFHF